MTGSRPRPAAAQPPSADPRPAGLWELAKSKAQVHRFSTLLTAQDVRDRLASEDGLAAAIDWCRKTGVTKVYIEAFRDGYQAKRETLQHAKQRFQAAGFEVSGCVTTTEVGKRSTGWQGISCYTDQATQERLQAIFEYAAGLFDEIMIDDFWFTDCSCPQCDAARKAKTVDRRRADLPGGRRHLGRLSLRVDGPAFAGAAAGGGQAGQSQGPADHQVSRSGTTISTSGATRCCARRPTSTASGWARRPAITATGTGAARRSTRPTSSCAGWAGSAARNAAAAGTIPTARPSATYLEQARQTVLGGAARVDAVLLRVAAAGHRARRTSRPCGRTSPSCWPSPNRSAAGRSWASPPTSPPTAIPENEPRVFDFVGMLGLPLVPCHEFPRPAPAALLLDPRPEGPRPRGEAGGLHRGGQAGAADRWPGQAAGRSWRKTRPGRSRQYVQRPAGGGQHPKALLGPAGSASNAPRAAVRSWSVGPYAASPRNRVGLYLFSDGSRVLENFRDEPAAVELDGTTHRLPARGWVYEWRR